MIRRWNNVRDRTMTWVEVAARQLYWRWPAFADWWRARRARRAPRPRISTGRLRTILEQRAQAPRGILVVHSAMETFELVDEDQRPLGTLAAAIWVLKQLRRITSEATLCMPTHPHYDRRLGFMSDKSDLTLTYDLSHTPSSVGLLTELFRRSEGAMRSEHPLSSLAAAGPHAARLLADNLNDQQPLPHGEYSSYYRLCVEGATVISLGLPLIRALTVVHVAEEVQDASWPVRDFFSSRRFELIDRQRRRRLITVRERRPEFVRGLALGQLRRDLLREGLLREHTADGVRIDVADARGILDYMTERQRTSTYPYHWPALSAWLGAPRATQQT